MSLASDMKDFYEKRTQDMLPRHIPVLMRLDGRAFHTLTKGCERPFDKNLSDCMVAAALALCEEIQGAKCAYVQSDEISVLITDFDQDNTEAWFDYKVQKMCSISAAIASTVFSSKFGRIAHFDSRVFSVPRDMVAKVFSWRQRDWSKNSLTMYASSFFNHKELQGKKAPDKHEMLYEKGVNWADLPDCWKNGRFLTRKEVVLDSGIARKKWFCLEECPIFELLNDPVITDLLDNNFLTS